MRIILIILITALSNQVTASDSFEEFKKQYQSQKQQFLDVRQTEYQKFRKSYLDEYDKFRASLLKNWAIPVQSSTEAEVIYTDDQQTRLILNEADQTLTIETLSDNSGAALTAARLVEDRLAADLMGQIDLSSDVLQQQLATQIPEITPQSIEDSRQQLVQQISEQSEKMMSAVDANARLSEEQKRQRLAEVKQETQARVEVLDQQLQTARKDPRYKNIRSYQVKLPGNYLYRKISPFIGHYQQAAEESNNDLALLLAISHAESSFNPKAKSHIPAFGLMQIVPNSAGLDVATKILKKEQAPSASELYQPETNILYGSSYLSILSERYLKKIEDPVSRKYCTIAAYNTGAGNVARAFNADRSRNIGKAVPLINSMSSDEVYIRLISNLPYDETKKYLKKVKKLNDQYLTELESMKL
ncbi:transglycosylase SLT domain-containing protein [Shewanella corallii]|uniref:Transglycosylase SLT domain-containing protein n=1 Tax=Shewanella corallii TaxID=560080 RepID=A0ABT0NCT1_9GAMM|nr:transglycosylase SLT domain-containing protein [Shewanella corallii]MCL2916283.1 transglycosylase SLT domain-containing protein [Shewanella corallii]